MKQILLTLRKQAQSGSVKRSTIQRMVKYDRQHPMWIMAATDEEKLAFNVAKALLG